MYLYGSKNNFLKSKQSKQIIYSSFSTDRDPREQPEVQVLDQENNSDRTELSLMTFKSVYVCKNVLFGCL